MLDALRFVSGAVSKLDTVPALTHFRVEAGFVMGFNGTVALCSPIQLALTATPNAQQFFTAIKNCDETIEITQKNESSISVRSGSLKATVDCTTEDFPAVAPDGNAYACPRGLSTLFKRVAPFVSNDPLKLWANGFLVSNESITVTNGIVLCRVTVPGLYVPRPYNVPAVAIKELIRCGDPIGIQYGEHSITFHFEGGRWLRSTLFENRWPMETVERMLSTQATPPIPEGLFVAVEKALSFTDGLNKLELDGDTHTVSALDGKQYRCKIDVPNLTAPLCYFNGEQLLKLQDLATHFDFSTYPAPCAFSGENVRGAIVGIKSV